MSVIDEIKDFTGNNLRTEVNAMGIEITDDELLSMEPQLLVKLQRYLKDYRDKHKGDSEQKETVTHFPSDDLAKDTEFKVLSHWDLNNAKFEEVEDVTGKFLGTRITQTNVTYIARQWRMTDEVKTILTTSAKLGFDKFWRFNHPQESYLKGNINYLKGCHHIGCSSHHHTPWIFALGAESLSKKGGVQRVKEVTFNTYAELYVDVALSENGEPMPPSDDDLVPGSYKIQKGGGKNITTHPRDFSRIIAYVADHLTD